MNTLLFKDTLRTVRNHFSRYISILLMVALGTAFFVGIKATSPDMLLNAEDYFKKYNLSDLRIQSSIGFSDEDLEALRKTEGVDYVSGGKFTDAFVYVNGEAAIDFDGTFITARAYSISPADIYNFTHSINDGAYMNRIQLLEGRYPQQKNECLVDASRLSTPNDFRLGSVITLKNGGNETPEALALGDFTVVGIIRTPMYLSFERGNTTIGSGKLGTFIIIPTEAFSADYYSEVYIKINGADQFAPFSDAYFSYTDSFVKKIEDASPDLIKTRVDTLRPELANKIKTAQNEIAQNESEAASTIAQLDEMIATLKPLAENGAQIVADAEKQFNDTFSQVESDLNQSSAAYQQALTDYYRMRQELSDKQAEYDAKQTELQKAKEEYDSYYNQYTEAREQITSTQNAIKSTKSLISAAESMLNQIGDSQQNAYSNEQLQGFITIMQGTYPDLYNSVRALTTTGLAGEIVANLQPYLESQKAELALQESQLKEYSESITALGKQLAEEQVALEDATEESKTAYEQLQKASSDLTAYSDALTQRGYNIQTGSVELAISKMKAENELNELKQQVQNAPAKLAEAQAKRDEISAQTESALAFAKSELADAEALYKELDSVKWSVFGRKSLPGYSSYGETVDNIGVLSNIFPIFFFIISSLVCLTTVTRLVEEDRVLLGTYKALGYSSLAVMLKYVAYSLSACVFGSALGIGIGTVFFPYAINRAYSIMYSLPGMQYRIPWLYVFIGFGIALLSTAIVTVVAGLRDLTQRPSVLMRPKTPKKGKKILLEHIRFIWGNLSFTGKVTARNLFRNKSRFFMTFAGIAGCMALLLASLGFYNSISAIQTKQFTGPDAISKYDIQVVFENPQTAPVHTPEYLAAASDGRLSSMCLVSMRSMTGFSSRTDNNVDTYILVPETPSALNDFFDLRNRKTGEKLTLDDSGAIITEKLAQKTETGVGDDISFEDASGNVYTVTVSAIAENYTFHYIYLSPAVYQNITGSVPTYSYAIANIADSIKTSKTTDYSNVKGLLSSDLMKIEGITTIAFLSDTTESISEITKALSLVILVFFVSALILAFVVLYNLANINIIERTRELATLKVLGFNDGEVNSYILRENIIVSLFGIVFGIALGIGLHRLLITFTAIDTVMYGQSIYWYSYVISVLITVVFIAGVNLLLRRKTMKIDMVESLKSVE